ncbi:MAG TPA: LuxR C-terminal-related transcriptional regulator [Candidatus Microbacterium stercoravium]|uniref:LuxR C-terminal-related transcriptional regulator n=1 Tax=Candidatus Microbacterium stercoravium TaxID=2838697 RepID=A0A9D2H5B0_9MICO|nr:LuxR C-terminal-related transcriptional regulator [Candidatus Microbacterium stercoravium]
MLTGIGSFAARRAGDADLALDGAKQFHARALAILSEGRLDESLVRPFVEVAYQAGVTMMLGDEREAAVDLLVEVERICRTHGLEYRRSSAQAALGYHYGLEGRLRKASALTRAASAYTGRQAHGDYSFVAFLQVSALVQAVMKADFVRLRHAVGSLGGGLAHTAHWDVRLLGEMLLDLAAGDAAAARVHFDAAIRAHLRDDEPGSVHRRVAYLRGILALFGETPVSVGAMTPRIAADPIRLALSAAHDIDIDDLDRAAAKLKKATTRASLPFAQHLAFVMLARLGLAEGDATLVRSAATRLRSLLRTHDLRIGFALLTEQERTASVESLSDAREMRAAFAATTAKPSRFGGTTAPLLTPRQLVVIRTLAELGDRQAVADKLFLSPGTVKAHLRAIYKKLGAHSQTEALRKAAQLGLLTTAGGTA